MRPEPTNDNLVLLVHGTYAASTDDAGDAWWQQGSPCWNALQQRLPAGARLPETGEVFHWSGENSERARSKASAKLLEHLLKFESADQSYHLVGHSHGGSVIAGTLRLASLRRKPLSNLGSWTTVGTPYLHARTRSIYNPFNLVHILIAILLLTPLWNTFKTLSQATYKATTGQVGQLTFPYEKSGYTNLLQAPTIKMIELAGVPITRENDSYRLGTYDPEGKISFAEYLFLSREGITLILVAMLKIYILAYLTAICISPLLESLRIRAEQRLERETAKAYSNRWLGVWSQSDEAINGLRATIDFSMSFIGRLSPRERIFFSDNLSLITRPYYWLLAPVYNRTARPFLDRLVRRLIVRTAQGNNRPAAEIVEVSPLPFMDAEMEACPPIYKHLDNAIVKTADSNARDIAPKLRLLLGETRLMAGLEAFGNTLSGKELVHTSYFDHAEILDLIAMNIFWSQKKHMDLEKIPLGSYRQLEWFSNFKQHLGVDVNYSSESLTQSKQRLSTDQFPISRAS